MKKHASFFIFICMLFIFPFQARARIVSVKADKTFLMSGPGKKYHIKWEYKKGFPLQIISAKGHWVKVKDFEKDSGWVVKSTLSDSPAVIVMANRHIHGKINIHSGPGRNYKVIGKAYYGVVFEKLEKKNGWIKIHHDSGLIGWVKASLVWGDK